MKKIWLLILMFIPSSVLAETYYTEYENYLLDQNNKIEINDLIKEEEIKYYHYQNQKINEGYYLLDNNPTNAPYLDKNDKKIIGKIESYKLNTKATRGLLLAIKTDFPTSFIEIKGSEAPTAFTLYDLNYNKIDYSFANNKIILEKSILISQLIIVIDYETNTNFDLLFNGTENFSVILNDSIIKQYEINFIHENLFNDRLRNFGIYTKVKYTSYLFYVMYLYNYKYYDLSLAEEIKTTDEGNYDFITSKYNYYSRDKIIFKDYLVLSNANQNLNEYITFLSDPNKLKISGEIDYQKNGIYLINYQYDNLLISKYVVVINDLVVNECKPIIEEKIIYNEIVKYRQCKEKINTSVKLVEPKVIEKIIKKDCQSKQPKAIRKDFSLAYVIPGIPLILIILLINKRKYKTNKIKLKRLRK